MRKLIKQILKEETSFVNHKENYQKYDKIINKLVYLVFDEGICSFTWDAFEIPTRNGHVTQIILNFTPESFRELGYEKYHKLRTELKDVIMNYVPLFTQVYVAYDTTKCDEQMNESEITEKCWKGYTQKGMKTMFGKRYPNCVKKTK